MNQSLSRCYTASEQQRTLLIHSIFAFTHEYRAKYSVNLNRIHSGLPSQVSWHPHPHSLRTAEPCILIHKHTLAGIPSQVPCKSLSHSGLPSQVPWYSHLHPQDCRARHPVTHSHAGTSSQTPCVSKFVTHTHQLRSLLPNWYNYCIHSLELIELTSQPNWHNYCIHKVVNQYNSLFNWIDTTRVSN